MTDTTTADKSEAIRLADALEREAETNIVKYSTAHKAAKELRRLYVLHSKDAARAPDSLSAVQKAWYEIGADVAGLDWARFVQAIDAARAKEGKA